MGLKNNFTLIFCIFYLGVFVAGTKETFEDLDKLLNDPNIWQYIEKRVGKNGKDRIGYDDENGGIPVDTSSLSKHPSFSPVNKDQTFPEPEETNDPLPNEFKTIADSSGNTCKYQQNNSMIIRSKTSLSKGAFYLKNAFGLTAEGCARKCCYTQNCNLAVYEDKEKHSCYLFDCGTPSKCTFAHHGNFSVMSFQNHNYEPHVHQQYHENELESLGETPRPTPPAPTTRKPIQDTPTPFQPKVKVPLYGDCNIDWGDQCGDRNAECRDEQCKCKHGYHAIYAYCRQICKDDEFQCKNKGQQGNVPDCIDNKHRCDGVPQCADGSDEDKCTDKSEKNISNKDLSSSGDQGSVVNPVITQKSNNQPVLLPTNDQVSNNQFYGQTPDKSGFINPSLYGNSNPLIPKQIQDYYWPQQQGILNNPSYQAPYPNYPQYPNQQNYLNSLGYEGQYNYPYNTGSKVDNPSLNSNLFGPYSPHQNIPPKKYPLNQVYDQSMNYKDPLQSPDKDSLYPKYDGNIANNYPRPPHDMKNLESLQKTTEPSTTTSTTTVTTTTMTTTTTPTTTTVVMTTRNYDDRDMYDNHKELSSSWLKHYDNHNSQQDKNVQKAYKPNRHFGDSTAGSANDEKTRQFEGSRVGSANDEKTDRQFGGSRVGSANDEKTDRHYGDSRVGSAKEETLNRHYGDSRVGSAKEETLNRHYGDSRVGSANDVKSNRHFGVGSEGKSNNYPDRYPYRFQHKGRYPDYEDRRYNWPEYYDERSEYPDFQRSGKKPDMYDNIFEGGDKETDTDENLKTGIDKVEKIEPDTSEEKPNLKPTANNIQDGSLNNVKHQEVEKEDKNEKEPVKENLIKTDQETEKESPKDEHQKPETKTSVTKTTKTPKTAQTQNLEGPEKVVVKSPTDSNQGPIVALALGLGICLMLLIFVGCRLRTVKRRIRRGKSLHSNEADYLINGMYL